MGAETKEEEAPWVSPRTEGRQNQKMDIPERTKFLTNKKEVLETPLAKWNKGATIESEAPPLSDTSFGERGNGATPPPQIKADAPASAPVPVHGAAKRVLDLKKHDPPKGTPVVAQQLGKENADAGAISKFTAFVANFVKPEEPGGATA